MIENGYIIPLNDDAIEVGVAIPCNFRHTSNGKDYVVGNDGKTTYFDGNILIQRDSFDYSGCSVYDNQKRLLGKYCVGQKRFNSQVSLFEMKVFKY